MVFESMDELPECVRDHLPEYAQEIYEDMVDVAMLEWLSSKNVEHKVWTVQSLHSLPKRVH